MLTGNAREARTAPRQKSPPAGGPQRLEEALTYVGTYDTSIGTATTVTALGVSTEPSHSAYMVYENKRAMETNRYLPLFPPILSLISSHFLAIVSQLGSSPESDGRGDEYKMPIYLEPKGSGIAARAMTMVKANGCRPGCRPGGNLGKRAPFSFQFQSQLF